MSTSLRRIALWALALLTAPVAALNPLIQHRAIADPAAIVWDGRVWIVTSNDDDNGPSFDSYDIMSYVVVSSSDMMNWTDHGEVFRVPRDATWANRAFAPAIAFRNGTFYLYFPDGGSNVGVATASRPEGPFRDAVGRALISGALCDGVAWCFDPGVFVDADGQAYLLYGGGTNATWPYGTNMRMIRLNANMTSVSGTPIRLTTPHSFEAPFMHRRDGIYYLSYSTDPDNGMTIDYMTSTSPTGPFTHRGTVIPNPVIDGRNINLWNNNHHSFFEFQGQWYAAYHDRRQFNQVYTRNVSVDRLAYNADGTMQRVVFTADGPGQVGRFNPYDSIPAATMAQSSNVRAVTRSDRRNVLIPVRTTAWTRLIGVDFGTEGAASFEVRASSLRSGARVEIRSGSSTGTVAGTCELASTGNWNTFSTTRCNLAGLTGVRDLALVFPGADSSVSLEWFRFVGRDTVPTRPREPWAGVISLPGRVEAENFDHGGQGISWNDLTPENEGLGSRRDAPDTDTALDATFYGFVETGEWIEWTVDVAAAGPLDWTARVASAGSTGRFSLTLGGAPLVRGTAVPNTGDWETFATIGGTTAPLAQGRHVLRLTVDSAWFNVDWIHFAPAGTARLGADGLKVPSAFAVRQTGSVLHVQGATGSVRLLDSRGAVVGSAPAISGKATLVVPQRGLWIVDAGPAGRRTVVVP